MPSFFETHCHLNSRQFAEDGLEAVGRARAAGVDHLVMIGCDVASSEWALRLADPQQGLYATAGIHPHDASVWSAGTDADLRRLLKSPGIVALGEIGLDFYRDLSPRPDQYQAFREQLALAAELELPVVIHTRDSIPECLEVLAPYAATGLRGVLHCWSGTSEQARQALAMGFMLGIGGVLTYSRPGDLLQVAAEAPLERLVLETDSPYLAPAPYRGRRNEPAYIPLIAARLAQIRCLSVGDVAQGTTRAAHALFGLDSEDRGS